MPDIAPYGVTQNADAEMVTANAMVGSPVGAQTGNAMVGNSAAIWSTAPYVPPRHYGCEGKQGACKAPPLRGTTLCVFHTPKDQGESPTAP